MDASSTVALHTGRLMPVIGLGTWDLTDDTAACVLHALAIGYRMIDTAMDYGSQPGIGDALERTDVPRSRIFLVAKVEEDDDGFDATRRYLDEMRQDYADLVLIHRPPSDGAGERIWEGLQRARSKGLARDIGVSNYSVQQLDRLAEAVGEPPVVNQIEWTPFGWSPDMLEACRERNIVIQAYSPLTRAYRLDDSRLRSVAERTGATAAQVLIRWNLDKGVVPLPKANQRYHMEENLAVFDIEIGESQLQALEDMNEGYSALGHKLQYL